MFTFPSSVDGWLTKKEGAKLFTLAVGKRVLEVGSYEGRSTICLAQSANRVLSVDPHMGVGTPEPHHTFKKFDLNLINHKVRSKVDVFDTSIESATSVWTERGYFTRDSQCDLLFFDALHDFTSVIRQIDMCRRFLRPGATITVHDYGNPDFPGVMRACHFLFRKDPDEIVNSLAIYHDPPFVARTLNIITPVTRPENIYSMIAGFTELQLKGWDVNWIIVIDKDCFFSPMTFPSYATVVKGSYPSPCGNANRNEGLEYFLKPGWVGFLDDDNTLHPKLGEVLWRVISAEEDVKGVVVPQLDKEGKIRLNADRSKFGPGEIDTAQFFFHTEIVDGKRWEEGRYDADGDFFCQCAEKVWAWEEKVVYDSTPASYYNSLR